MLSAAATILAAVGVAPRAVWTVLTVIGPEFEKKSGYKLSTTIGLSTELCAPSGLVSESSVAPTRRLRFSIPAGSLSGGRLPCCC
jgi:hypothetical protein